MRRDPVHRSFSFSLLLKLNDNAVGLDFDMYLALCGFDVTDSYLHCRELSDAFSPQMPRSDH